MEKQDRIVQILFDHNSGGFYGLSEKGSIYKQAWASGAGEPVPFWILFLQSPKEKKEESHE